MGEGWDTCGDEWCIRRVWRWYMCGEWCVIDSVEGKGKWSVGRVEVCVYAEKGTEREEVKEHGAETKHSKNKGTRVVYKNLARYVTRIQDKHVLQTTILDDLSKHKRNKTVPM